jgi:hypothetical protein
MGRFLSILLLSASFVSGSAGAAAIGQVSAYSSANKPLRMDIELVDLQGVRINDVFMRVADEIDHERFGLQRPAWADGSFARVLNKDSDSFVARLSSTRAVSDSNVDFVVELRAGSAVTWHKVSASVGSGSPLVAVPVEPKPVAPKPVAPKPVDTKSVAPEPMVEQPVTQPEPAPVVTPEPVLAAEVVQVDDIGLDDAALTIDAEMVAEPVFEEPAAIADTSDMTAIETTEADAESKLKPHQYFNRVLILFFILCFAIAGLIGKVVKKIRKS